MLLAMSLATALAPLPDPAYDPLVHMLQPWLGPSGALLWDAPPENGTAPLNKTPSPAPQPVVWSIVVPGSASSPHGLSARLLFRSDVPVLPRVSDNAVLEVASWAGGEPVDGNTATVQAPVVPLEAGAVYEFQVLTGAAAFQVAAGQDVGLAVTFVGLAPGGQPALLLGANASRANLTLQFASLDALPHDHPGWEHLPLAAFVHRLQRDTTPALDLDARHGLAAARVRQTAAVGSNLTLRLDNAEMPEQGRAHGPWGVAEAHSFRLRGAGVDAAFQVYPGEGLLRNLSLDRPGEWVLACEKRCTPEGPIAVVEARPPGADLARLAGNETLQPGEVFEARFPLTEGQRVRWRLEAGTEAPVTYALVRFDGAVVVTHAEGQRPLADGTLAAPRGAVYALRLQNAGSEPVDVRYRVEPAEEPAPPSPPPVQPAPPRSTPVPVLVVPGAFALAALLSVPAAGRRRR